MPSISSADHFSEAMASSTAPVLDLFTSRRLKPVLAPFVDNLDYLQSLEQEALLILMGSLLRRHGRHWMENPDSVRAVEIAGWKPLEMDLSRAEQLLAAEEQRNRQRAQISEKAGVPLYFLRFCRVHGLDGFQRTVLLMLFMLATSKRCAQLLEGGDSEAAGTRSHGATIATLLEVICRDERQQLACRRHFSVDAPLMQKEIIVLSRSPYDFTTDVLQETIYLDHRYVRYMQGDNNLYGSGLRHIHRERGTVRLSQVILAEETKADLVARIGNYLAFQGKRESTELDAFYGYGTGLTLLFHGPSGTGKTMMANALAAHFDRPIYSFRWGGEDLPADAFQVVKQLWQEASLNGGIVFFDEADDLVKEDSPLSYWMLTEIEKAHCVVIMATNKPGNLDPAMDRRLAMKVFFPLPDAEMRYRMWQSLLPAFVKLAPDVDLRSMAERYVFSGGLIKN